MIKVVNKRKGKTTDVWKKELSHDRMCRTGKEIRRTERKRKKR